MHFTLAWIGVAHALLAPTPPMGWNAWNHYGCDANETIIRTTADRMIELGLAAVGYNYVNLDDCWQLERNKSSGRVIVDGYRFPSGLKALSDYIHSKDLKFGIYSSAGTGTCMKRPGSLGYEVYDAQSYAEWGVDLLKYDNCLNKNLVSKEASIKRYKTMADALHRTGRDIVYSVCNWGQAEPWLWADEFSQMWRTTADIGNSWDKFDIRCSPCFTENPSTCPYFGNSCSIMNILDKQVYITQYTRPGGYNDLDLLQVGNGMTHDEDVAHFSLWAALKSPLIISTDLGKISDDALSILKNEEVIAVNKDPLGKSARLVSRRYDNGFFGAFRKTLADVWAGDLSNDSYVVILLNRDTKPRNMTFSLKDIEAVPRYYKVRDLWAHKNIGVISDSWTTFNLSPHSCKMYKLAPRETLYEDRSLEVDPFAMN